MSIRKERNDAGKELPLVVLEEDQGLALADVACKYRSQPKPAGFHVQTGPQGRR